MHNPRHFCGDCRRTPGMKPVEVVPPAPLDCRPDDVTPAPLDAAAVRAIVREEIGAAFAKGMP
jgi:hypothetical protein